MIRLAVIFCVCAAPLWAQSVPQPRPEGLVDSVAERAAEAEVIVAAETLTPAQLATPERVVSDVSEADRAAIRAQIRSVQNCWNAGALPPEAAATSVAVAFEIAPDGVVISDSIEMVEFSNGTQASAEAAFHAARRAIIWCGALGFDMPPNTYSVWQRVELNFDASARVSR